MRKLVRRLLRSPMFTVAILITLAIGIGATTAIFSVIEGVLLKPLPYPQSDRLVAIWHTVSHLNVKETPICASMYFTYREENRSFEDIGIYLPGSVSVTQLGRPEQVQSLQISQGVLPILRARPFVGRLFTQQDDTQGSPLTVIVSYGYWQKRFGAAPSAIGQRLIVDGEAREIIGVLPANFRFLNPQPDLFIPVQLNRNKALLGNFIYRGIARLKPGVTIAQANADVARMIPIWLRSFPAPAGFTASIFEDAGIGPGVRPLMRDVVGDIGSVLWVLMMTIATVLLIACANVANLLLVRAEARQQELAMRAALGAGWGQIARELLAESVVLAIAGGVLGLALAYGAVQLLVAIAPTNLPRPDNIHIDPWAILFTVAISLLAGLLFGSVPVFKYANARPGAGLRDGNRSVSAGRERHRTRNVLVIVQVTLSIVLLISSGLMIRTFQALRRVEPGFTDPEQVLTLHLSIPDTSAKEPESVMHIEEAILSHIAAVPGVEAVGLASSITMDGHSANDVLFTEDHPVADGKIPPVRRFKYISPGLFRAIGQRFISGRDFTWTDFDGFRPVAIISENLARLYWHDPAAAVGKRIRESSHDPWREIIGVVGDEYDDGPQSKPPTVVYWPLVMRNFAGDDSFLRRTVTCAVRSKRTGSFTFLNDLRKAVWSVSPDSPLADVQTLSEIYSKSMMRTAFTLVMLAIAGSMALVLAVVGLYAAISYSVAQRRREIGIRMALGARQQDVSGMFVRHGLLLTSVGIAIGLAAAAGLTHLIASMLFGVGSLDVLTYSLVAAGLLAAALLASYLPARRVAEVNPVETLRSE